MYVRFAKWIANVVAMGARTSRRLCSAKTPLKPDWEEMPVNDFAAG